MLPSAQKPSTFGIDGRRQEETLLSFRYLDDGMPAGELTPLQKRFARQVAHKLSTGQYALEHVPCAVCGGQELSLLAAKDRYGLPVSTQICRTCGLIQTNPRMDQAAYQEFYNQEYRPLYEGALQPTPRALELQYARGRALRDYVRRFLLRPPEQTWILEVGCGAGGVIQAFREVGFQVQGIDLGADYVEYGRSHWGLDLRVATVHDVEPEPRPHIVLYSHVAEHLLDIRAEFRRVRRLLAPDGLLVVETPGLYHLPVVYQGDFLRYLQNAHTYTFSLRTLRNILEPLGFQLLSGTEMVRAVFVPVDVPSGSGFTSDYARARAFLQEMELQHLLVEGWRRLVASPMEAAQYLARVTEAFPRSYLAHHLLALALERADRRKRARQIRARARRLIPAR